MKFVDLKGLNVDELSKKRLDLKEQVFHAKMKNSLGQLGNPLSIRLLRRDISRIELALKQKRITGA